MHCISNSFGVDRVDLTFEFHDGTWKKFDEFQICWNRSKSEHCRIRMRTLSHP